MSKQVFRDEEIKWFYWIEVGVLSLVLLLGIVSSDGVWYLNLLVVFAMLGFLYISWPLSAEVMDKNHITFRYPLRKALFTPESLAVVKVIGARDYRAHIVLRNRYSLLPVGYRCRKYTQSAELAQAVLNLIEKAPDAKVTKDALKLLQQTAKGSRKPLPHKK